MTAVDPNTPELSDRGVIIGQSELLRTILLAMVVSGLINRGLLTRIVDEVLGGIRERGYDPRYLDDASRYVRDILARVQEQVSEIERLSRENERPQ
jgi:hypothetical protein